jgi:hypothetical protein
MADDFPDTLSPDQMEQGAPSQSAGDTDPFPDTMSDEQFSKGGDFPDEISDEDFQASPHTSSKTGVSLRGLAEGALPAVGGLVTGLGVGAAVSAATSPFITPVGGFVAGAGAGITAGTEAQKLIKKGQDWALEKMGLHDPEQEQTDIAQHPYIKEAAEMAPAAALLKPTGSMAQRAAGAGVGGAAAAYQQYMDEGKVDWKHVAEGAGFGGAFPNVNRLGGKVMGGSGTPASTGKPGGQPIEGEVIPPEAKRFTGDPSLDEELKTAYAARDSFDPGSPLHSNANDYIDSILSRGDGKDSAFMDLKAEKQSDGQGTRSAAMNSGALGNASEAARPSEDADNTGNPDRAPMQARIAARPSSLLRDYRKGAPQNPVPAPPAQKTLPPPEPQAPVETGLGPAAMRPQPPEGEATATVTPYHQKIIDTAMNHLQEAGHEEVLARLKALPPDQQVQKASQLLHALASETGEAKGAAGEAVLPRPARKMEGEGAVTVRNKGDLARKQGSRDAIRAAVAKFGGDQTNLIPTSVADKTNLIGRLKQMVDHGVAQFGGKDPTNPKAGGYRPNVKESQYQIFKAAQKVVAKPTPANINEYFKAAQAGQHDGDTEAKADLATEMQKTNEINARIEKGVYIPEAAQEAQIAKAQQGAPKVRPEYTDWAGKVTPAFEKESGYGHRDYNVAQGSLRTWLRGLSDEAEKAVRNANPDIENEIETTRDPVQLKHNYATDLAEAQTPKEVTPPAPTGVVASKTPTRNDPNTWRTMDKNSPEFKALAAKYGGFKATPEEAAAARAKADVRLQSELSAETAPVDPDTAKPTPVRDLVDQIKKAMGDQSGSFNISAIKIPQWIKDSWAGTKTDIQKYAETLGGDFTKLHNAVAQYKHDQWNRVVAATAKGEAVSPAQAGQGYRAKEWGEEALLPAKVRDWDKTHIAPMASENNALYDKVRYLSKKLGFDPHDKLYERVDLGNGFPKHVPRMTTDQEFEGGKKAGFDPISTRRNNLNPTTDATKDRSEMGLQNDNGDRRVIIPGESDFSYIKDGKFISKTNFNPGGGFDPRQIGDKITRNGETWTVTPATIDEIKQAYGKNAAGDWVRNYHDNPALTYANSNIGLYEALQKLRTLDKIMSDPTFTANQTRDSQDPRVLSGEFELTKLPQFKGIYMPKSWAWTMDDFAKEGFNPESPSMGHRVDQLGNAAAAGTKLMFFLQPTIHMGNEFAKWAPGRGLAWLPGNEMIPKSLGGKGSWPGSDYKNLAVTGAKAMKSVYSQDDTQRRIRAAGGNPMLMHTISQDMMPHIARQLGIDIAQNEAKWNPIAAKFNTTTPLLLKSIARQPNKWMWAFTDSLYTQRFLESELNHPNWTDEQHVDNVEKVIDAYHMPPTIGTKGAGGRLLKQLLSDRMVTLFGHYKYGLYNTLSSQVGGIFKKQSSPYERADSAAAFLLTVAGATWGMDKINDAYKEWTGRNSDVGARGAMAPIRRAREVALGTKSMHSVMGDLWTPSVLGSTAKALWDDQNPFGKQIMKQGDPIPEQGAEALDYLMQQYTSPLRAAGQAATGKIDWPEAGKRMLEGQAGITTQAPMKAKTQKSIARSQDRARSSSSGIGEAIVKGLRGMIPSR